MERFLLPLVLSVTLALWPLAAMAAALRVEEVEAFVTAGENLPPLVRERMEMSVKSIAEQLILGTRLEEVERTRRSKEKIISEVFDKVLVGYTVRQVTLTPGEVSEVHMSLQPWDDVIRQTEMTIIVEGMPPEVEALVRRDLEGVEGVFAAGLAGLPLAAADWSNGALKQHLNGFMAEHLPEFRADFDILPEPVAKVTLTVYPRLPVVRTIDLSMRSDTVPNFMLLGHRELFKEKADMMVGVPVNFIRRHQGEFARSLAEFLDGASDFRALDMSTEVRITAEEKLKVVSHSNSKYYRLRLEGWFDTGHNRHNDDVRLRLSAGRRLSRVDDLFLLVDVYPQNASWNWNLGYSRDVWAGGDIALRYDLRESDFILGMNQNFLRDWRLRYEYRWTDRTGEWGLSYKLHDFLRLEYVNDRRDNWLRFIGYF